MLQNGLERLKKKENELYTALCALDSTYTTKINQEGYVTGAVRWGVSWISSPVSPDDIQRISGVAANIRVVTNIQDDRKTRGELTDQQYYVILQNIVAIYSAVIVYFMDKINADRGNTCVLYQCLLDILKLRHKDGRVPKHSAQAYWHCLDNMDVRKVTGIYNIPYRDFNLPGIIVDYDVLVTTEVLPGYSVEKHRIKEHFYLKSIFADSQPSEQPAPASSSSNSLAP